MYDILTSCLFIFLNLLKITFIVTTISFYPKWDLCFQLKVLKTRFYCFHFLIVSCFHFHWKYFQISNQTHFHHHFLFSVKIKTKNNQTKHSLQDFKRFRLWKLPSQEKNVDWESARGKRPPNLHCQVQYLFSSYSCINSVCWFETF